MKKLNLFIFVLYISTISSWFSPVIASEEDVKIHSAVTAVLNEAAKLTLNDEKENLDEWQKKCYELNRHKPAYKTSAGIEALFGPLMTASGGINKELNDDTQIRLFWYYADAPAALQFLVQDQIEKKKAEDILQQEEYLNSWLGSFWHFLGQTKKVNTNVFHVKFGNSKKIPLAGEAYYVNKKTHDNQDDNGDNLSSWIRCTIKLDETKFNLPPSILTELIEAHIKAKLEVEKQENSKK
jgi:hypothetical protein